MTKVMRKAYTEVDEILKYLPKEYVEKIPQKIRRMFNDCRLEDYKVNIDPNKSIEKQNIIYETLVILTLFKYYYWCNSEEEKKQIEKVLIENDKKNNSLYDFSKLNERPQEKAETNIESKEPEKINNLPMVVEKKSWFSKLILKIKNLFKK